MIKYRTVYNPESAGPVNVGGESPISCVADVLLPLPTPVKSHDKQRHEESWSNKTQTILQV